MTYRPWDEAAVANLKRWWNDGVLAAEIGQRLGRTAEAVSSAAARFKLETRRAVNHWPPERDARLSRLWAEDMPASAIAEAIGARSKNAVIGRARRLGLKPRVNPVKPTGEETKEERRRRRKSRQRAAQRLRHKLAQKAESAPVTIRVHHEVRDWSIPGLPPKFAACQWIEGDPKAGGTNCGADSIAGRPYCQPHCERAFRLAAAPVEKAA